MKNTWTVKALTISGEGTTTVKNGIRTYTPPKAEWTVIREFEDFEKAENWMTEYIRENGFFYGDFKITK